MYSSCSSVVCDGLDQHAYFEGSHHTEISNQGFKLFWLDDLYLHWNSFWYGL